MSLPPAFYFYILWSVNSICGTTTFILGPVLSVGDTAVNKGRQSTFLGLTFYGMNLVKSKKMDEYIIVQIGISTMKNDKEKKSRRDVCVATQSTE